MQTIPVNPTSHQHSLTPAHTLPTGRTDQLPAFALPTAAIKEKPAVSAGAQVEAGPYADLDAMLINDPNTGAVHGVRFALLFNAGLALSGLLVWELWTLLVP